MAVVDSTQGGSGPPRSSAAAKKESKGLGAWVKKHKGLSALLGGGGAILLLAHKGSKSEESASSQKEAIEAAAQERAALNAGIVPAAAPGGESGGSGSSGGGGPTSSNPTAENSGTATDPALADAVSQLGGSVASLAAIEKEAEENASAATHPSAQKGAPKKKVEPKHATKPEVHITPQHGGVNVNGRFFPGATGSTLGPVIRSSNGETHRTVTIKFGGRTETFTSHNGGKSWTDNTPGHTPPSRGAPKHTAPAPHHAPPPVHHPPAAKKPAAKHAPRPAAKKKKKITRA